MATFWPVVSHRGLEGFAFHASAISFVFSRARNTGCVFLVGVLRVVLLFPAKLLSSENAFVFSVTDVFSKLLENLNKSY